MTDREHLVQDLRAHAHEAPATCAALMRRAASELARDKGYTEQPLANGATLCRSTTDGAQSCS